MILFVGKFGFGIYWIRFLELRLGLLIRVSVVLIILLRLCGGILVVILIVILFVLLISMFGNCVGRMVGFLFLLL